MSPPTIHRITLSLCLAVACACAGAQDARVPSAELDRAISEVISQAEYTWRAPRDGVDTPALETPDFLVSFVDNLADSLRKVARWAWKRVEAFIDWIQGLSSRRSETGMGTFNWQVPVQLLLFVLLAVTLSVLAVFLLRLWRGRHRARTAHATNVPFSANLLDEDVAADELPADEWLALAHELFGKGELRLALRAMFLAGLSRLARADVIQVAIHKSNREYLREIMRRAYDVPGLVPAFTDNVRIIEWVWYGLHEPTTRMVDEFRTNHEVIYAGSGPVLSPDEGVM